VRLQESNARTYWLQITSPREKPVSGAILVKTIIRYGKSRRGVRRTGDMLLIFASSSTYRSLVIPTTPTKCANACDFRRTLAGSLGNLSQRTQRGLAGSISSVEAPGMLSPKEPANRAAPEPPKGRKLLKSSGQTKEIRTSHCLLQEPVSTARRSPSPFGSAYGLSGFAGG
jgi:hypothetical protein